MRQKHLIVGIVFLVLCSFLPLTASSQALHDLQTAVANAENTYTSAYASYEWSHNYLETMIDDDFSQSQALLRCL